MIPLRNVFFKSLYCLPELFFVVVSGHSDAILNPSAFPQWFQLIYYVFASLEVQGKVLFNMLHFKLETLKFVAHAE